MNRSRLFIMQDQSLAKLDEVLLAIEAATTVQEIKSTIDAAIAIGVYTKQAKLGRDIELKASEYILRAERKLGEMLAAAKAAGQIKHGGDRGNQHTGAKIPNENLGTFTLKEAGIDPKLSMTAQQIAAIPKKDFEKKISEGKESGKLTSKTVMKPIQVNGEKPKPRPAGVPKPHFREEEVLTLSESGLTVPEIAEKIGNSPHTVRRIIERGRIRHSQEPVIEPAMISMTAQQKLDLAIKQHKAKLTAEFHASVNQRVQEFLESTIMPKLKQEQATARRIIEGRKGIMSSKEYRKILACLHPDRVMDEGQKAVYTEAFRIFNDLEKLILNEKDSPTQFAGIPTTPAEWEELKRKAAEAKNSNRQTGRSVRSR